MENIEIINEGELTKLKLQAMELTADIFKNKETNSFIDVAVKKIEQLNYELLVEQRSNSILTKELKDRIERLHDVISQLNKR